MDDEKQGQAAPVTTATAAEEYFASAGYIKLQEKAGFNHIGKALLFQTILSFIIPIVLSFVMAIYYAMTSEVSDPIELATYITEKIQSALWYMPLTIVLTMLIANTIPFMICAKKVAIKGLFQWGDNSLKTVGIVCVLCLGVNTFGGYIVALLAQLFNLFGIGMPTPSFAMGTSAVANFLLLLATCVLAPITEEFIFRGVLLRFFSRKSEVFAVIMSSLLFAIIHGNIPQGMGAFFIGIVFGYIAIKTKSIIIPIIGHIFNNVMATIMGEFVANGGNEIIVGVIQWLFLAATIAFVVVYLRKKRGQPKAEKVSHDGYKMAFSSWSIIVTIVIYLGMTAFTMSGLVAM